MSNFSCMLQTFKHFITAPKFYLDLLPLVLKVKHKFFLNLWLIVKDFWQVLILYLWFFSSDATAPARVLKSIRWSCMGDKDPWVWRQLMRNETTAAAQAAGLCVNIILLRLWYYLQQVHFAPREVFFALAEPAARVRLCKKGAACVRASELGDGRRY